MISILVLNPFSVLHLSFPLFLTSFFLAPIVWLPVTLFDTQSLKKNVFEVTSDQIFLQIFHFFFHQSFLFTNSTGNLFSCATLPFLFSVIIQRHVHLPLNKNFPLLLSIFPLFTRKRNLSCFFFIIFFIYVSARGTLKISKVIQSHYNCY